MAEIASNNQPWTVEFQDRSYNASPARKTVLSVTADPTDPSGSTPTIALGATGVAMDLSGDVTVNGSPAVTPDGDLTALAAALADGSTVTASGGKLSAAGGGGGVTSVSGGAGIASTGGATPSISNKLVTGTSVPSVHSVSDGAYLIDADQPDGAQDVTVHLKGGGNINLTADNVGGSDETQGGIALSAQGAITETSVNAGITRTSAQDMVDTSAARMTLTSATQFSARSTGSSSTLRASAAVAIVSDASSISAHAATDIDVHTGAAHAILLQDDPAKLIGEYGVAGSAQAAAIPDASGGTVIDVQARAALNAVLAYLRARGSVAT